MGLPLASERLYAVVGGDNMGIFDTLKNAILGSQLHAGPVPTSAAPQRSPTAGPKPSAPSGGQPAGSQQGTTDSTRSAPVDIEAVLNQRAAQKQEKLNWQSSIVDLMKLVDLDPSLENRKTLAHELGYSGDTHDTAQMNVWLHRAVMQRLAASGGKVPDSLHH